MRSKAIFLIPYHSIEIGQQEIIQTVDRFLLKSYVETFTPARTIPLTKLRAAACYQISVRSLALEVVEQLLPPLQM